MREFLQYHRRMFVLMICVCLAATIGLGVSLRPDWSWAGGFAAGSAAQLFKFGFLDIAAVRKIAAEREAAASTQLKSMFLSLIVFGLAVVTVFKSQFNVWAMAAGIFLPRVILLIDAYVRPNPFSRTAATDDAGFAAPPTTNNGNEGNNAESPSGRDTGGNI